MENKILCPTCGQRTGNEAIMTKMYGATCCQECLDRSSSESSYGNSSLHIGLGKDGKRIAHWDEIRSRVTTHDGEFLSGRAGRDYQRKWSKQMLGKDLSRPTNYSAPEFQRELAKAK